MTAQIAILNKSAIALASDSAVTIGGNRPRKTYNTVNKLFTLSKYAPVGVMFYGNADFMGVPWESILKMFRHSLGKTKYSTITEYAAAFLKYVESHKGLFPPELQTRFYDLKVAGVFKGIKDELDTYIASRYKSGQQVTPSLVESTFRGLIQKNCMILRGHPYMAGFNKLAAKNIVLASWKRIEHVASEVFQKLPRSAFDNARLKYIACNIVAKDVFTGSTSGVVIAGFGEAEHFPNLISYNLDCIVDNKLRHKQDQQASITHQNSAQITPFAQVDMVSEFMEGVHPSFVSFFENRLTEMFRALPEQILKFASNPPFDSARVQKLANFFGELLKELNVDQARFRRSHHITPVIDTVAVLPKEELATMAAALVNLTQFRQKITLQAETVGGPVDVAVISKGDGFVWINRKHYFDPKYNPHFFHNYYLSTEKEHDNEDA